MESFHLPQEIIEEIVARLPVKSLLRFRCVSKSWRSLISKERFIETHLQNSTKNTSLSHHTVIFEGREMKQCSLLSFLNRPSIDASSPIYTPKHDKFDMFHVLGCCNGLFCFIKMDSKCFLLWNPATRISMEFPLPASGTFLVEKCGFGWDETSGAYKVCATAVCIVSNQLTAQVYSTKTNSWKTVECGARHPCGTGRFACGKLHWFESNNRFIELFDLGGEEFGRIEAPSYDELSWLGEIGGCLGVMSLSISLVNVWVMKEYGVKDSWFKLVSVPLVDGQQIFPLASLLREEPNGEILVIQKDTFCYTEVGDVHCIPRAREKIDFFRGYVYVESLVSPVRLLEKGVEEGGDSS